ncbi:MAG: UDP-N-acetylmuramate:L-alanyl-gamma-D-glutamyl-meso-diaminopimelate ligase [Pseudomonadota bacterium]
MHIHILGICGTFMGGVARLAIEAGHTVSGADANVYPPMSTQLAELGIDIDPLDERSQFARPIDQVVVGNAMTRGYPAVEFLLNSGLPYLSGPQWLAENVLVGRHVLAVAGTHGKTTTTSMLAWILEHSGHAPGFLIGGVPTNFNESARSGTGDCFVVEADEYDSAFFDKRSKFVHYRPHTLILNNLEFDHADIFHSLADIQRQFHHVIRTVPSEGLVLSHAGDKALEAVLEMGCWSQLQRFGLDAPEADWRIDGNRLIRGAENHGWCAPMPGRHNSGNALAAVAAAHRVGVSIEQSIQALSQFEGVARRLQVRGQVQGVTVIDDFAHHPTAIRATLEGVRTRYPTARLVAVLEPRSNTMKTHVDTVGLSAALAQADVTALLAPEDLQWDVPPVLAPLEHAVSAATVSALLDALLDTVNAGDVVVIMSNGSFGGLHDRLLDGLRDLSA